MSRRVLTIFSVLTITLWMVGAPAGLTFARTPSDILTPSQGLNGGSSARKTIALTTDRQDIISTRSLSIVVAGGLATWLSLRNENQGFIKRFLEQSAFDLGCDAGDVYGTGIPQGVGILGLVTVGYLGDQDKLTEAGRDLSLSLMASGAITWALKIGLNRKRPNGGKYSFPSGHTAVAFSTVPVVGHHFGWKTGIAAGALAGFTALGRMEENKHYLSDVIFGASVGLAAGYATVARRDSPAGLGFLSIGPGHAGIKVRF